MDIVYLDLAKAFDKVPHQHLLLKLKAHGIGGLIYHWIQAWLADRWQWVCLNGSYSTWKQVWSGVPQGSVLGPVLFLIFVNDLDNGLSSKILKLQMIPNFFAQSKIRWMVRCYRKTWMMLPIGQRDGRCSSAFSNVKSCITARAVSIINIYSMNYQPIDEVKSEKELGVTVSNDLKAAAHCKEVYAKANRMLDMISRTIKDRNPKTMTSLYKSLVRPHLEYSSVVWFSSTLSERQNTIGKSTTSFHSTISRSEKLTI